MISDKITYKITMNDCCVYGKFTAKLVHICWQADETGKFFPYELIFDNGVSLTEWMGCEFEEIP